VSDKIDELKQICKGMDFEIFQDETLMANAQMGSKNYGIPLDHCTPTFILKADESYVALIIQGSRKIDFKKVEAYLGVKKVKMASREEIMELTGSPIGSVSLINPLLQTLMDRGVSELEYCYGGCGVENHTLKINARDLIAETHAELDDFTKDRG
jgi:prolyl-tRNA editing enzyme YbaK/EbsC (Cys-tRNA(Pro) deacylase)